ncbi:MAG TPA: nodulation protein NfeD [Kiloniellales bacterium]|nr:nodulation protein NfeD [Kiloniellales bacterium]
MRQGGARGFDTARARLATRPAGPYLPESVPLTAIALTLLRISTCLVLLAALISGASVLPTARADAASEPVAVVGDVQQAIGPATTRYIEDVLEAAEARDARLIVLRLDTPGGLSESMRDIIRDILGAPIPVVVYVAPSGGRAASAGTYILYASHLAAMAPGTNIGAATPVPIGGSFPSPSDEKPQEGAEDNGGDEAAKDGAPAGDAMQRKILNDSVAFIRSLAELRGRNPDWAERAVREGVSLTATEALEQNVVEIVATSVSDLLDQAHGRSVTVGEREVTLDTQGLAVEQVEPSWVIDFLAVVTNPNVALILMMIGVYGLIFEFLNPGSIGPGVIGAISLVIGLYALNLLPLDYTGLGLLILGIALMVAEAVTPTFGVLGIGGLTAFVLGTVFLLDSDSPEFQIGWPMIAGTTAVTGAVLILLMGYLWRAHRRPAVTGAAEVVGQRARVVEWAAGEGYVDTRGERWRARGTGTYAPGDEVMVDRIDGLTLEISPADGDNEGAKQ